MKKILIIWTLLFCSLVSAMQKEKNNLNLNALLIESEKPAALKISAALKIIDSNQEVTEESAPTELIELVKQIKLLLLSKKGTIEHKKILFNLICNPDLDIDNNFQSELNKFVKLNVSGQSSKQKILNGVFFESAFAGDTPLVKLALNLGADIDFQEARLGITSLMHAAVKGHKKTVKVLIKAGANVNSMAKRNYNALTYCVAHCLYFMDVYSNIIRMLLDAGIDIDSQDKDGNTALMLCIRYEREDLVSLLIERGANLDIQNKEGNTALINACNGASNEIFKALLDAKANTELKSYLHGRGALAFSVDSCKKERVKMLLDAGANIDIVDKYGFTPLMKTYDKEMVTTLIESGANCNFKTDDGRTALSLAEGSIVKNKALIKLLTDQIKLSDILVEPASLKLIAAWSIAKNSSNYNLSKEQMPEELIALVDIITVILNSEKCTKLETKFLVNLINNPEIDIQKYFPTLSDEYSDLSGDNDKQKILKGILLREYFHKRNESKIKQFFNLD